MRGSLSRGGGLCQGGVSAKEDLCLGGSLCLDGVSVQRGLCLAGSLSRRWWVSVQGGAVSVRKTPPYAKEYSCLYRLGTVNSKSFVGKVLLRIKWKFKLTVYFKHGILGK